MITLRERVIAEVVKLVAEHGEPSLLGQELCRRLGEDQTRADEICLIAGEEFGRAADFIEERLRHDEIMAALRRIDAQIPPDFGR